MKKWLIFLLLAAVGCNSETPTPVPTVTATPAAVEVVLVSPTAVPATFTPQPQPMATQTAVPPSPVPTPSPQSPIPAAETAVTIPDLVIHQLSVSVEDLADGSKDATISWAASRGTEATISVGTSLRFAPWQSVNPDGGTIVMNLTGTNYRDPIVTLAVRDDGGNQVTAEAAIVWDCSEDYFFAPPPAVCPRGEPSTTAAAEQQFEYGRMVWLQQIQSDGTTYENWIIVLYNDGTWQRLDDTWTAADPESDPSLTPPVGLSQPVRGFGKVWREHEEVRSKLGWATGSEEAYTAVWQWQTRESIPSAGYLQLQNGRVLLLFGDQFGNWSNIE